MQLKVKKLRADARLPVYSTLNAAGADLYACLDADVTIPPHGTAMIGTGLAFEIPVGYGGFVYARSGIASRRGLAPANKVGVIDADYRGELIVSLHNQSDEPQTVAKNERVAQLVIAPYLKVDFTESEDLSATDRGAGGFGSTGQ